MPTEHAAHSTRSGRDPRCIDFIPEGNCVSGLVSVVIPTFNRAYILGTAIESALAQIDTDIE